MFYKNLIILLYNYNTYLFSRRDVPLALSTDLIPETRAAEHHVIALVIARVQGRVGAVSSCPLLAQLLL